MGSRREVRAGSRCRTAKLFTLRGYHHGVIERVAITPIDHEALATAQAGMPHEETLTGEVAAFQLLGDATRARILYALARTPLCVRDLALLAGVSESAVFHQLRLLRQRRLAIPYAARQTAVISPRTPSQTRTAASSDDHPLADQISTTPRSAYAPPRA